jgi:hypothetical protein
MAMTSEERGTYALCGAKKKNGERCRAFAGQHTDHLGTGRCKYHGGSTPSHKTHAVKVEAEQRMATLGGPINVTPAAALMGMLRSTAGSVSWLDAEVKAQTDLESPEAKSLVRLWSDERDRLTRIAAACLSNGIGKAEVEMAEAQTEALAKAINAAMSHVGGLSHDQKRQFGQALRRELAGLSATDPALEAASAGSAAEPVAA